MARRIPCRGRGLGVHALTLDGHDGLDALLRPPRAQGVAVIGPVLGAVGTRGARYAQAQGTAASIRPVGDLGAETAPAAAEAGIRLFFVRAHDRAVPPHGGPIRIRLPIGHPARPDAPISPVGLTMYRPRASSRTRPATDTRGPQVRHPA